MRSCSSSKYPPSFREGAGHPAHRSPAPYLDSGNRHSGVPAGLLNLTLCCLEKQNQILTRTIPEHVTILDGTQYGPEARSTRLPSQMFAVRGSDTAVHGNIRNLNMHVLQQTWGVYRAARLCKMRLSAVLLRSCIFSHHDFVLWRIVCPADGNANVIRSRRTSARSACARIGTRRRNKFGYFLPAL